MTAVEFLEIEIQKVVYIAKSNKVKFDELMEQAKKNDKRLKHEYIESQVAILKDTLDEMMTGFDSEEDRMDFILDICNGYKKRIETKQQEQ
jgi:uncharacterized protein YnzC (UPF0291/DUF896 family)